LIGCSGGRRAFEPIITRATTEPDILRVIDEFKARLGGVDNDGATGSQPSGFRLIGWDAIGAGFLNSNAFPGNFFNSNRRRGMVMTTPGTGFRVTSQDFQDINATYPLEFHAFSLPNMFSPIGSNVL